METLRRESQGPAAERSEDDVFVFPASFAQQRLWFLDQLDPGAAVYNVPLAFRLDGPLNVPALTRALSELGNRHESLRTTFGASEGVPVQIVAPAQPLAIDTVDLRALPDDDKAGEALRMVRAAAARAFVLDRGPLFRVMLGQLTERSFVLVLNVHHIVCDGSSLSILLGELSQLYGAFTATPPAAESPLPPPALQYADYAVWQTEHFQGGELGQRLTFWRHLLSGELPVLALPADRPRPPTASYLGGQLTFPLSAPLTAALGALGRREGASLFMTLLAAYQLLLYRLGGQDDVLVGTPIVNRDSAEIENSVGFFTNTVVFRSSLAGAPTFRALLSRVKEAALRVLANQDMPFEKVVEAVHPARATSASPLFQAMFGMQKAPTSALTLPDVRVTALPAHAGTSKFDLTLDMQELDDGSMQGLLEYAGDLFDDATAARFAGHYQTLLQAAADDPDRSIDTLPILTADQRRTIVTDWNATAAPIPAGCLHEWVAAQAARTPEAVAVTQDDRALTYGELDRRASALAAHLRTSGLGAGPSAVVGIFVERSPEMVVALLGTLKAGAAYLPLDPAYPPERIRFMLEDAAASVIITSRALAEDLPENGARLVRLDESDNWEQAAPGSDAAAPAARPDDLAYVIYTSGSTGRPKGVELPHGALSNFIASMQRQPGMTAADRLLAVTTLSFDIAALEMFLPLSLGATIVLATREEAADGPALLDKLRASRATVLQATPATFRLLLAAGWLPEQTPHLKVLCGGEALAPDLARALLERTSSLWNMYGPTETTVWSTCALVTDADDIVIGRPIANTQVFILGPGNALVPPGTIGELVIGGAGVARGYRGRPELTAERFIANPFGPAGSGRLYRTGDRARQRGDGTLECLGRADAQVKVRGFRIELGEIEATLSRHPGVGGVAVAVKDDAAGDRRIVAYVVHAPGESPTASELRKFARRELPDHMIPHLFVDLPALPLTANGKIDRRQLPDPLRETARAPAEPPPPQTPTQIAIAAIWSEALALPRVGLTDNFFDVGGHSLLSMQVIHRIHARLGKRLGPRSLAFQNLEQLAAECDAAPGTPP
ncbi:MAG TPA: amino acid adenylation domain-containing protein [Polyangia bacterium]|jgi:amino acid adenylation domain-containing protein|nr:amino acid adenylation domain-containing protein [Polyangia bacterium]